MIEQAIRLGDSLVAKFLDLKEIYVRRVLVLITPLWITADQLSLIRILCFFPIIYLIWNEYLFSAFAFFVLGSLLDLADGPLARMRGQETNFGKILDPFADKVLANGTLLLIFLKFPEWVPSPLFWSVMCAEAFLVFMSFTGEALNLKQGSNIWGKFKFTFQSIAIPMFLLKWILVAQSVLWGAFALAVLSIVGHIGLSEKK